MDTVPIPTTEDGKGYITKEWLKKVCDAKSQYRTPRLNTQLLLHHTGISKIELLDEYININALWLQDNSIRKIENLDQLSKLKSLYLNNNFIQKIEGLDALACLKDLSLQSN